MRPLSDAEKDVLTVLTESYVCPGAVRLASDLYQRGTDFRFNMGDPVGFVVWLLEELAELGLLRYRVPSEHHERTPGYDDLPYHIRLTPEGWAYMGYSHVIPEVGVNPALVEVRKGDPTDWRNHSFKATGGPIERLPWREHKAKYPTHPHGFPLWEDEDEEDMNTRAYTKVTPELEERVVASYIRTGDYQTTARETNVPVRSVNYIIRDRATMIGRPDSESLKQRMLRVIRDEGPFPNTMALYKALPGSHGLHNMVHVLHSLNKAGLVEFRTDSSNAANVNYLNIRIRKDVEVPRKDDAERAIQDDTEPKKPVAPTVVGPTWPELTRIKQAAQELAQANRKATQYMQAAELLAESDPETAELLLAKAAEAEHGSLSPVEAEYLSYAEDYPRGTED